MEMGLEQQKIIMWTTSTITSCKQRNYVNAIAQRPYIRHMPGCRSFFHSKGKTALPSCYCGKEICFHPC